MLPLLHCTESCNCHWILQALNHPPHLFLSHLQGQSVTWGFCQVIRGVEFLLQKEISHKHCPGVKLKKENTSMDQSTSLSTCEV